ncbi:MAG: amino acid ABC transporter substrate-binding protein [Actinobacteria bacterium]|nr:amino acid ABC transporter substrate-binding protein [Actinomycetota bacterium]
MRRPVFALVAIAAAGTALAGASAATAQVPRVVTALTIAGNGPFDIRQGGKLTGFDIQMVNQAAEIAGIRDVTWRVVPFDSLLDQVQNGAAMMGASSITITPQRAGQVTFGSPYLQANMGIVTRRGTTGITGRASLKGQTIGVLEGSTAVPVAQGIQGAKVLQYTTMPATYKALLDAKVNAVINDYGQSRWYVTHNANKFRYAGIVPVDQQYGLAFNDDQDALRVAMNRALAKMKRNGQYQALLKKWGLQSLAP